MENTEDETSHTLPRRNLPHTSKMTNSLNRVDHPKGNVKGMDKINKNNEVKVLSHPLEIIEMSMRDLGHGKTRFKAKSLVNVND